MSNKKKNSSKQEYEKSSQLQKANEQIEELQKEKETLRKLLLQYQSNEQKKLPSNDSLQQFTTNKIQDKYIDQQKQYPCNKFHQNDEHTDHNIYGKASLQSKSNLHERNISNQQIDEQNRKQPNCEEQNQVTLKTENIKDEVLRLGQTMQEIYKKIEGYEKVNQLNKSTKENHRNKSREHRDNHNYERSSNRNNHKNHHSKKRYLNKKSPKKSYESTDSDEYNQQAGEFSSSSSSFNSGTNSSQRSQDKESDSRNSSMETKNYYYSSSKQSHKSNKKKHRSQKEERSKIHHSKNKSQQSNTDNKLEEEALQLLNTIQLNPSTKLAFIQKFGNEELFLETLKKSKNDKVVLLQIIRMMLEIVNGSGGYDFSSQLYAQNSYFNQANHKKSFSNSNFVVSPIHMPQITQSRTQYVNNISGQFNSPGGGYSATQQYTGENLIRLLEKRSQNPSINQQNSFLKSSSLQQNNPMFIQSNLNLNNSSQGQLTTDQLTSSQLLSNTQSRFGLLNYYPEKPKIQFQLELRDIQNREALLKMQEYESQIEGLEGKLKNLRQKVEDENLRRTQEEADRLRRQQEDYLRRKAEREQEELLRKQKIEQEEFERLRREKEEYERRIRQYKEEEDKLQQKIREEQERLRRKEEEERRLQKEKEDEERRRKLTEQQDEDERRLQRELQEQQERLRLKLLSQVQNDQLLTEEKAYTSESESNKKIPDYMKVTKNRCNYVKDVQKDYLRRSNSIGSNGSTPKSKSVRNSVANTANQNWEKVLNKFTENAGDNNSMQSDVSPVDSDFKRKSNFATIKASIHKINGENTPKSQKNQSNPAQTSSANYNQTNFADLVNQEVEKQKQLTSTSKPETGQLRSQTPKSNKSQYSKMSSDISPQQQKNQQNNDQQLVSKSISPKQQEQSQNNNQVNSDKSIKSDKNSQINNQQSERMISDIQIKVNDKSQTQLQQSVDEDQKLINLLSGNKEEPKKNEQSQAQFANGQTFSKIEAVEDNLQDELEQLNNLLEMKKQQKKKTIIQQANTQIEVIKEEKENSIHTGRAADQKSKNQGTIQNESDSFSNIKDNDSNLISPQTNQVNSPPIFTQQIEQQKPNLNLSFSQANQLNSQEEITSKRNYDQKDKSISQIAHNQSEDFSQLGIENELLCQNQIGDTDENISNINDLSSPNQKLTTPIESPQVSSEKPIQHLKSVVKSKVISQLKSAGSSKTSNSSQGLQTQKSDSKKTNSLQSTAQKAPATVASTQPKVTSYLQKKQTVSSIQKSGEKSKTEPSNQNTAQNKSDAKVKTQQSLNIGSQSNLNKSQLVNKSTLSTNQNNNSIIEQKQGSYTQIKNNSTVSKPTSTTAIARTLTKSQTLIPKPGNSSLTLNSSTLNKSKVDDNKKTQAISSGAKQSIAKTSSTTTTTTTTASSKSSSYAQKAAIKQKTNS